MFAGERRARVRTGAREARRYSCSPIIPNRRILASTVSRRSFAAAGARNGEYRFGERRMPASIAASSRVRSAALFEK